MKFEEKIYELRRQAALSQEQLAEKLNVSRQAVSRWEQGTVLPDTSNIVELSKIFGVSTDYLLNDEYGSDQDIPAVIRATSENKTYYKNRMRKVIGLIISGISVAVILTLLIVGSIMSQSENYIYVSTDGVNYYGIYAFLKVTNLMWLMILCGIAFVAGIIIAWYPSIKEWFNERIDE